MLWNVIVLMAAIAMVFSVLSFFKQDTIFFPLIACTTWFILVPCFFYIEVPVSVNVSAVNSTVSGVSQLIAYTSAWPFSFYFLGLGITFLILTLYRILYVPQEFVEGVRRSGSSV